MKNWPKDEARCRNNVPPDKNTQNVRNDFVTMRKESKLSQTFGTLKRFHQFSELFFNCLLNIQIVVWRFIENVSHCLLVLKKPNDLISRLDLFWKDLLTFLSYSLPKEFGDQRDRFFFHSLKECKVKHCMRQKFLVMFWALKENVLKSVSFC